MVSKEVLVTGASASARSISCRMSTRRLSTFTCMSLDTRLAWMISRFFVSFGYVCADIKIDFYDWTPTGVTNFIMRAGSATQVTEFDIWMLRDWWRHLKSRYNL